MGCSGCECGVLFVSCAKTAKSHSQNEGINTNDIIMNEDDKTQMIKWIVWSYFHYPKWGFYLSFISPITSPHPNNSSHMYVTLDKSRPPLKTY